MNKKLIVKNTHKSFGKSVVLKDVSLEVNAGETVVIYGPSGCGKTTLLRIIAGLEVLDKGEIFINGGLVSSSTCSVEPHKRGIGFVFQSSALWSHMTVKDNILFGVKGMNKKDKNSLVSSIVDKLDISQLVNRYPSEISGGQARRVAIARALVVRPDILLFDEPLTNLESDLKSKALECILEYVGTEKACLIYVTHDIEEVNGVSDRILNMKDGMIGS